MNTIKKSLKAIKYFVLFILSVNTCGSNANDIDNVRIKSEVLQSFESLVSASKALNVEQYFQHFDDKKFTGLNSDGTVWHSIEDLKILIEQGFSTIERVELLHFTLVKLSVIDENTVVLVNEFEQNMILKEGSSVMIAGGGTQVWSKSSGDWKLVSISASNKSSQN